ncbi:MAG: OmpH family outer membrane protein [Candidatus Brocadiaceae bacterium]|nr:OmpH family outer membrane protein [Candidatus Brocadiaceae bacterium]
MTHTQALKAWGAAVLCATAVLSVAVGGARGADRETPAPAAGGIRIAVVDMEGVLRGCRQWRDSADERMRALERVRRTLTQLSREVQVLRNDYENLPPGTDERARKGAEVDAALRNLEQQRSEGEMEMARFQNESVRAFFAELTRVVSEYAQEHDVHLVLKKQALDLAAPDSMEQNLQIATAEVLYAAGALDITPQIVERLNAAYLAPIEAK